MKSSGSEKKGLILLAECSLAEDMLVGMGCAAAWRGCYTGMANFGLSPATLRKIETGEFIVDDIGHIDIILGAMASMAGSPFVATRATLGSDVLNPEFSRTEQIRALARDPSMIPEKKFVLMDDPFYGSGLVKLQPAMPADVAVIHVQQAGEDGTGRIEGSLAFDHYFIHAAKLVILTAEQVVPETLSAGGILTAIRSPARAWIWSWKSRGAGIPARCRDFTTSICPLSGNM